MSSPYPGDRPDDVRAGGYSPGPGYGPGYGQEPGYGQAPGYGYGYGPSDPAYAPVGYGGGPVQPSSDERSLAVVAHLLGAFVSFVAPLVIYLTRDRRDYAKVQAAEALDFTITVAIAYVVSLLLCVVLIGFVLLPIVGVWSLVMAIVAAVRSSRGEAWRYPLTIHFVSRQG